MCDCFALEGSGPRVAAGGVSGGAASGIRHASVTPGVERSRQDRRGAPWVDVHAHPGRFFVRGLPQDESITALVGRETTDRALADLAAGGVDLACFATVSDLRVLGVDPARGLCAGRAFAPGEAYADHQRQLAALDDIATRQGVARILTPADLEASSTAGRRGILLTCEGGDFLEGRLERVAEAYDRGVRSITLVHYRVNELGDIQTEPPTHGGLTPFGVSVVREMNRLGMIVDLAHAPFDATKQALDVSTDPVMISHSHLAGSGESHPRLLSREHARAVARSGGLVGAWPSGVALASFDDFLDEILRMVDVLGVEHVAIGTDMDANYRPVLHSYRQFPDLAVGLGARGLAGDEVAKILGGNFIRLFAAVTSRGGRPPGAPPHGTPGTKGRTQ